MLEVGRVQLLTFPDRQMGLILVCLHKGPGIICQGDVKHFTFHASNLSIKYSGDLSLAYSSERSGNYGKAAWCRGTLY